MDFVAVGPRAIVTQPARTQASVPFRWRLSAAAKRCVESSMRMVSEEAGHGRLVLFSPVFLGAGAATWFLMAADFPATSALLCLLVLVIAVTLCGYERPKLQATLMAVLLFVGGMLSAQIETWRARTVILDSAVTTTVTGRVERREGDGPGRWRYILGVSRTDAPEVKRPPERISVLVRGAKEAFELGAVIEGRARLTPPAGPALPQLYDFAFGAYYDGIGANGFFYGAPKEVASQPVQEGSVGEVVLEWLFRLRSGIGDRIRSVLPGDTGAFAASLVTDERRAISDETTEALRQSGLAHIVAISGLNMALSAGIFYVGLRVILSLFASVAQAWPTKKIAAAGALAAVTAYYLISGFAVSAERAFIMMAIMLIAVFFDRPSISLRNVALSALVILAVSPSEVLGPSFQMSFAATLALVAGYDLWKGRPMRENALAKLPIMKPLFMIGGFFGGIFLTSLIGGFSTALFSIEHFHRLSTYGLPANLAAMPVISFIVMPSGMMAMLLMPFGLDGPLWQITGFGLDLVIKIAKTVSDWGGNIDVGRLPGWYFPTAVFGFLLLTLLKSRLRHAGTAIVAASTLTVALLPGNSAPDVAIAEDGGLVAVVDGEAMASNREKPPSFIFQQWQRALAIEEHQKPIMITDANAPAAPEGKRLKFSPDQLDESREVMIQAVATGPPLRFTCLKGAWCTVSLKNGKQLTVINNAAYLGPACDTADIVVTPVHLRFDRCRSGAMLFTGETLRKTGSVELRFTDKGLQVATAFDTLLRPWMRHRAYDWRSDTFADDRPSPISDSGE
ncbi:MULTISPECIES: ComEC/Rec2 family competence protein [unclassified Rhizobium]|uniref:ComEC/Rec2 family competence protein n=2 Tax=unclassified Rhizobium TaxID=2613769 RepID=UPI001FDFFCA9|nr:MULTISPECIES: ComEC/Rec2 family competence protein [unclassified Rhizobium]